MSLRTTLQNRKAQKGENMMEAMFLATVSDRIESLVNATVEEKLAEIKAFYSENNQKISKQVDDLMRKYESDTSLTKQETLAELRKIAAEVDAKKDTFFPEIEAKAESLLNNATKKVDTYLAEVKRQTGEKGDKGDKGEPGKNGSPDTPKQVVAKVNEAKGVEMAAIKGLLERIKQLDDKIRNNFKSAKSGGGMGNFVTKDFSGNGSDTTFTLDTKVASGGTAIVVLINGQVQEQTTHYSVSGTTLTFTTAPPNGTFIHAWYVRS